MDKFFMLENLAKTALFASSSEIKTQMVLRVEILISLKADGSFFEKAARLRRAAQEFQSSRAECEKSSSSLVGLW